MNYDAENGCGRARRIVQSTSAPLAVRLTMQRCTGRRGATVLVVLAFLSAGNLLLAALLWQFDGRPQFEALVLSALAFLIFFQAFHVPKQNAPTAQSDCTRSSSSKH